MRGWGVKVVYAGEALPEEMQRSLYLAGPSPRDAHQPDWRADAVAWLAAANFDGVVFVPLARDGVRPAYADQMAWEQSAINRSDQIVFWIPRTREMLGLTTNVEFGAAIHTGRVVLGAPADALSTRYLSMLAEREHVPTHTTLEETLSAACRRVDAGALRRGGECMVPLDIWNTAAFQEWLTAQRRAGNRLDGANVQWTFRVGRNHDIVLAYAMLVDVWVAEEQRHKSNEFILSRPDIAHTIAFWPDASDIRQSKVVLVREFRSPGTTAADGFIHETPGGSGYHDDDPQATAAAEFHQETGVAVDPRRLVYIGRRQVAATFSTHAAHVFALMLTRAEIDSIGNSTASFGVAAESERTVPYVTTLGDLLDHEVTDWSNLGMVLRAISVTPVAPYPLEARDRIIEPGTLECQPGSTAVSFRLVGGGRGTVRSDGRVTLDVRRPDGESTVARQRGGPLMEFTWGTPTNNVRAEALDLLIAVEAAVERAGGVAALLSDPSRLDAAQFGQVPLPTHEVG